jgi:hypothetical protein
VDLSLDLVSACFAPIQPSPLVQVLVLVQLLVLACHRPILDLAVHTVRHQLARFVLSSRARYFLNWFLVSPSRSYDIRIHVNFSPYSIFDRFPSPCFWCFSYMDVLLAQLTSSKSHLSFVLFYFILHGHRYLIEGLLLCTLNRFAFSHSTCSSANYSPSETSYAMVLSNSTSDLDTS